MSKGYHLKNIKKGTLGEISKIREELEELEDADAQGVKIMAAVEASDLLGALVAYTEKHHNLTVDDLISMSDVTRRAFESGCRVSKPTSNNFDIPTIEWLKAKCKRIYYFGLGFVQVVVSDTERYHFYHPELPAYVEDIHTHRYDFTSYILKGTITNLIYDQYDNYYGDYNLYEVSCNASKKKHWLIGQGMHVDFREKHTYNVGEMYDMDYSKYHTIDTKTHTITKIVRGPVKQNIAQVATKNESLVCAFSKQYEEDFLWDKVQEVLDA